MTPANARLVKRCRPATLSLSLWSLVSVCPLQGLVYALDIAQLMGDKMPVCKAGDFEQWTVPADDHTPRCLLGTDLGLGLLTCFAGQVVLHARREKGKTTILSFAAGKLQGQI